MQQRLLLLSLFFEVAAETIVRKIPSWMYVVLGTYFSVAVHAAAKHLYSASCGSAIPLVAIGADSS